MRRKFKNADEAYNYFLDKIITDGIPFGDTKALFNVGFTLEKPLENYIFNKEGGIAIENWEELKEMERKLNWIDDKCKNLNWFDVQIFKIYYLNNFSLTTMQMATKINRNTLGKSVRIVKNYLKNEQEKT